ncbi:arsenate reductase (glutaredoxin) [Mesoflavibacter profundi]|uniref:Arsenate reductase (Glutaredoxin) n=1 Tax=Mesoflavibacter profundi TaxID=2708110 RepID=A0ABT4RY19_9FLAO|nr:arsenate reductase (glutaredoxin) [Mesoflavibacter profundi]MDA0176711.1 arsenate reductase (glutaredoxin) [Mesoflavibacter profundi]
MTTIYHNPRCRKSREGLQILENTGINFKVIKYLEDKLSEEELTHIISLLDIKPIELVRKNESIWKTDFKDKQLSDKQIIKAMVDNPKLIERPIVISNNKAIIGRPPENVKKII